MNNKTLRKLAIFASGLAASDFIITIWFAQMGYFPVEFMGRMFTSDIVLPTLIFDAALFLILVHYGWHVGKIPAIRERSYLLIAGIVFSVVAAAHLLRVFLGIDLVIGTWAAPLWLSWFGLAVTTYLAYMSFRLAMRMKR